MSNEQSESNPLLSVRLSSYEWHALLKELERALCVVNRDTHNARVLYNAIASQLAGSKVEVEVKFHGKSNVGPDVKKEVTGEKAVQEESTSWFKRLFG